MSTQLSITYYADRDMLGLVSDEDYEAFKDMLLEHLVHEWPKGAIAVDDGENAGCEIDLPDDPYPNEKAKQDARLDVESRVHEIVGEVIEERQWATEEFEAYDDDYEEDEPEERVRGDSDDY